MTLSRTAAIAAAIFLPLAASPALACPGGAECYDRVRLPDVYETVERPLIVSPGFREVVATPPVVETVYQPVVVQRAGYRWESSYGPYGERRCKVPVPAEVKYVERAVLVRPGTRYVVDHPPVVARERARVLVRRGGVAWQRSRW